MSETKRILSSLKLWMEKVEKRLAYIDTLEIILLKNNICPKCGGRPKIEQVDFDGSEGKQFTCTCGLLTWLNAKKLEKP